MGINIFEPTLEVQHPTFDYNRLQIQGTFPRNQQIPTDMFPTYSVMAGIHNDKQEGKVATFTEDNRLRVDTPSSGGGGLSPEDYRYKQHGVIIPQGGGYFTEPGAIVLRSCILAALDVGFIFIDGASDIFNDVSPQQIYLTDTVTLNTVYLTTFFNHHWDGTQWIATPYNVTKVFTVPIDLRPNAADGGGVFDLTFGGRPANGSLTLGFYIYG